jgi:hypothetical protein
MSYGLKVKHEALRFRKKTGPGALAGMVSENGPGEDRSKYESRIRDEGFGYWYSDLILPQLVSSGAVLLGHGQLPSSLNVP